MSRRLQQIPVRLDDRGIKSLPPADIQAILRAADSLIGVGGRSLLAKILRGSRSSDVLSHGLDQNPAHGFYSGVPEEVVLARIDWMILYRYLRIIYTGRLPVLAFTQKGWDIERETYADEIVRGFDDMLANSQGPYAMEYLKDRNGSLVMTVLDKVEASGDAKYVPLLDDWARVAYKKTQQRIGQVQSHLAGRQA